MDTVIHFVGLTALVCLGTMIDDYHDYHDITIYYDFMLSYYFLD